MIKQKTSWEEKYNLVLLLSFEEVYSLNSHIESLNYEYRKNNRIHYKEDFEKSL